MAHVVIGCDNNNGKDHDFQNTVANALEKEGHTVEKYPVGPNFASYAYSGKSKGKIGVFIIAPALTALCDFYDGNINFKYSYFGIRGDVDSGMTNQSQFETVPIHKDKHGDCKSKSCNPFNGKTYTYINNVTKAKCQAVFGATPQEMAENLIKAMGGEINSSSNNSSSSSSIKEALKEVISAWDGDIECFVREDTVYVQKIADPTTSKLSIIEFQDVVYDSISITDINPQTPNILNINYKGIAYEIKDEELIERFGENVKTISINDKDIENKIKEAKNNIKKYQALKLKYKKNSKEYKRIEEYIKKNADKTDKNKILQEYIEREWKKLQRDNGRTLELEVKGNSKWKGGQWVRVYLPSFNIDDYMYISKMSQDDSEEWTCNLTLVDYPPSLGKPTKNDTKKSTDNSNTEEILDEEN